MRSDVWVRRLGWCAMVGLVLLGGRLVNARAQEISVIAEGDLVQHEGQGTLWIGVTLAREINEALRVQLKLAPNEGVLVQDVHADSPAAKAGVKPHDLLTAVGEEKLTGFASLAAAVDASEGAAVTLHLIRGGEPMTIEVTPGERPNGISGALGDVLNITTHGRLLFDPAERAESGSLDLRIVQPGVLMTRRTVTKIPDDLEVTIIRKGNEPAQVAVEQGERAWRVTEESLGELPDDVRGHVEGLLNRGGRRAINLTAPTVEAVPHLDFTDITIEADEFEFSSEPPEPAAPPKPVAEFPLVERIERRLEQRFEKMTERLEQLNKMTERLDQIDAAMEKLQQRLAPPEPPQAPLAPEAAEEL